MLKEDSLKCGKKPSIIREIRAYGINRKKEIGSENVFDFSIGNPSTPAPECINKTIVDILINDNNDIHSYTDASGLPELKKAISLDLQNKYDLKISDNHIFVSCGAAPALTATFRAILNKNDEVIVIAPYFTEYRVFVEGCEGVLKEINAREKDFMVDLDLLKDAINENTKALLINSPNNPTGSIYDKENLEGISKILNEAQLKYNHPIYLVSDEPYRELVYDSNIFEAPLKYYNNSIMCYSYSKSMSLPGERIGYVAVNDDMDNVADVYAAICGAARIMGHVNAPSLLQKAISKCIGNYSNLDDYIYNRELLVKTFDRLGFEYNNPKGAFYILLKAPNGDATDFMMKARKHEILFVPSDDFGYPGYVRIAYCVSRTTVENSIKAFEKLKEEYK